MTHIENGRLVSSGTEHSTTAQSEYDNGRLDANVFEAYSRKEVTRIDALDSPSFAERHWARGAKSVLTAKEN